MRKLTMSLIGAIALGSSVPAVAAESIAQELSFTTGDALFDGETSMSEEAAIPGSPPLAQGETGESMLLAAEPASEVTTYRSAFNARVLAVPEPRTWLAMIVGLGVVGYTLRTRKRPLPQAV